MRNYNCELLYINLVSIRESNFNVSILHSISLFYMMGQLMLHNYCRRFCIILLYVYVIKSVQVFMLY